MFRKKRRIGEQPQGQTAARPKAAEVDPDAPPPGEQEENSDDGAGPGGPEDVDVADMKEIQRLRKLRVGVRADGLAKRKNKEDHGSDDEEQGHPRSPNAGNTDGDGRVTKRGGLAFTSDETGRENAGEKQLTREEEHMEAYIEAQLQAEMAAANRNKLKDAADAFENGGLIDPTAFAAGSSSSSSGAGAGAALPGVSTHSVSGFTNSSTTSLFQIPERLRVKGHRDILDDSEKNVNWNQGLAEVEVPTKLRMENMIAAEEAKKKVLETLVAEKKKELAKKQMHLNPNPQRVLDQVYGTRFQGEFVPKSERTNQPTDDDAVKAFRKRTGAGVMKGSGSIQWPQH